MTRHDRLLITDEERALRELAHDVAKRKIRPVTSGYDRDGTWPRAIIENAWEVGLMNVHIPEENRVRRVVHRRRAHRGRARVGLDGIGASVSCNGLRRRQSCHLRTAQRDLE